MSYSEGEYVFCAAADQQIDWQRRPWYIKTFSGEWFCMLCGNFARITHLESRKHKQRLEAATQISEASWIAENRYAIRDYLHTQAVQFVIGRFRRIPDRNGQRWTPAWRRRRRGTSKRLLTRSPRCRCRRSLRRVVRCRDQRRRRRPRRDPRRTRRRQRAHGQSPSHSPRRDRRRKGRG